MRTKQAPKLPELLAKLQDHNFSLWKTYQVVFETEPHAASVRVAELLRKIDFLDRLILYLDTIDKNRLTDLDRIEYLKLQNRAMEKLARLGQSVCL